MEKLFRHIKRGSTYRVLGEAEAQVAHDFRPLRDGDKLTVYQAEDGRLWARFVDEFHDGRFEDATPIRRWWPAEYADEIMPGGTASPDEWIVGFCGASWIIGSPQAEERKDYTCFLVLPGAEVGFSWHEPRGHDTLTIFPDGTWKLATGEPADWTFVFSLDDYENSDDSLDALARSNVQMHGLREGDEPVTLEVGFAKWGHAAFRLEVKDREAKLAPVEPEATAKAAP